MNRQEALEYLGVSLRSLERYTAQKRIPVYKKKTSKGQLADYLQEDLDKLKAEIEAEQGTPANNAPTIRQPSSIVYAKISASDMTDNPSAYPPSKNVVGIEETTALAIIPPMDPPRSISKVTATSPPDLVQIAQKFSLSITEAAALSGFSANYLREAITKKELKATFHRRMWRIKPDNLREWVNSILA